jgi:Ca2+-binding EF-hand superfamily protein
MRADKDKDGKLSAAEWNRAAEQVRNEVRAEGVDGWPKIGKAGLFGTLDADKDGFVTPAEIDAYYGPRFSTFDTNHDGAVTRSEANAVEKAARK